MKPTRRMNRPGSRAIALGALLMLACAGCSVLDPDPRAEITRPSSADTTPVTGQKIYLSECASCHGTGGAPIDRSVADLRGYQGTFEDLDAAMTLGPGGMPQFPGIATADRRKIFEYIKTFPPK